jgi:hypothetical protein
LNVLPNWAIRSPRTTCAEAQEQPE